MNRTVLFAGMALALTVSAARADAVFTPASLPPGETKHLIDEYRAREIRPGVVQSAAMLRCIMDVTGASLGRADADCGRAMLLNPGDPEPYKVRGTVYLLQGHYERALDDLTHAVEIDAADAGSYATRGEAHRALGDFGSAVADLSRAIALSPKSAFFWNSRCWARAEANRELAQALADCGMSLTLFPKSPAALDSRDFVYLRLRQYDRAIRDYDAALQLQPAYPSSLFGRGIAKLHLKRIVSGKADIVRARALDPEIDGFFANLGITTQSLPMPAPQQPKSPRKQPHEKLSDRYANR